MLFAQASGVPAIATPQETCKEDNVGFSMVNIPVVNNKRDLQRLNGQSVILLGRYQRVISNQTNNMKSPMEFMREVPGGYEMINPKIDPMKIPDVFQTDGFANIILEDGWIVPISPRGRKSLRSQSELIKYDAQFIRAKGTVSWWGGTLNSLASGIDVSQLRLACKDTKSQPIARPILMAKVSTNITVKDFEQKSPLGTLGQPLGEIITISGVVRQTGLGVKSALEEVLSVESVNGRPLSQPVTIPYKLFMTAQVAKPLLGESFKYVGYETGGFTGVPPEAFKYVSAVATTGYRFNTSFEVLTEELDIVKTKSDLIRFNNRRVQVIGRYVSYSRPAPAMTSSIDFKGTYTTANIVLDDGTEIPIYPTYLKQSLRSSQEVKTYEGQTVKVIGKIQFERDRSISSDQKSTFVSFDGLWLHKPNF